MLSKSWLKEKSGYSQLLFLASFAILSLFIFIFFAQLILQLLGYDILNNYETFTDVSKPENIPIIRFLQITYSIGAFAVPPLVFALLASSKPFEYLSLNTKMKAALIAFTVLITLGALPLINLSGMLNEAMTLPSSFEWLENWMKSNEEQMAAFTEVLLEMNTVSLLLINLFMLAVLPAFGEELLFRGVVQKVIAKSSGNVHIGIWLSAAIFSAIHVQFYGFLPRMFLGALFGYLLVWGGSLWYPIIAHFVNNGSAVLLSYYIQRGTISEEIENLGTEDSIFLYAASSAVLVTLLLIAFKKQGTKKAV